MGDARNEPHLNDACAHRDLVEAAAVEGYRAIGGDSHHRVCREEGIVYESDKNVWQAVVEREILL